MSKSQWENPPPPAKPLQGCRAGVSAPTPHPLFSQTPPDTRQGSGLRRTQERGCGLCCELAETEPFLSRLYPAPRIREAEPLPTTCL